MSKYETIRRPQPVADKPTPPPKLDFYMPAMPPLGLIAAVEHWWKVYRRRRQFRRRFLPLLAHDDRILDDMGHHRDDILWASCLPLKVDAFQALEESRVMRKAQQGPSRLSELK